MKELKRRKIVQWSLAYLAGAWVVLQLLDIVAEPWGIGDGLLLAAQIVLAFGFFVTLVLVWYHGEQGRQRVSGPELLMLAALLVIAGAAIAFVRAGGETRAASAGVAEEPSHSEVAALSLAPDSIPERSVAVLPLENQSPAEEHAYFAPALTDEITATLTRVPELRVTSYNSASQYPGSGMTVREFALEKLGVAHVIEGSVQRLGDRVRIRAQLIDARMDEHLWSETYERELTDVFDVQVEIARQVADRLAASFSERAWDRVKAETTDDQVAYELEQRARDRPREEAIALLRQALARDPEFGVAWFRLGFAYADRVPDDGPQWADSARVVFQRGIEHVEDPAFRLTAQATAAAMFERDFETAAAFIREALEANPSFELALDEGADIYSEMGDLRNAARLARRATALNPLEASNWMRLAILYRRVGLDDRAERALERAIEAEPSHPAPWITLSILRALQARYPQALAVADSAAVRDPGGALPWRGWVQMWAGDETAARKTLEAAYDSVDFEDFWRYGSWLGHLRLVQGDTAEAHAVLDGVERSTERHRDRAEPRHVQRHEMEIAGVRGNVDGAVESLRRYVDSGGRRSRWIARDPVLSRVRDDSAFQSELTRLQQIVDRHRRQIERDFAD